MTYYLLLHINWTIKGMVSDRCDAHVLDSLLNYVFNNQRNYNRPRDPYFYGCKHSHLVTNINHVTRISAYGPKMYVWYQHRIVKYHHCEIYNILNKKVEWFKLNILLKKPFSYFLFAATVFPKVYISSCLSSCRCLFLVCQQVTPLHWSVRRKKERKNSAVLRYRNCRLKGQPGSLFTSKKTGSTFSARETPWREGLIICTRSNSSELSTRLADNRTSKNSSLARLAHFIQIPASSVSALITAATGLEANQRRSTRAQLGRPSPAGVPHVHALALPVRPGRHLDGEAGQRPERVHLHAERRVGGWGKVKGPSSGKGKLSPGYNKNKIRKVYRMSRNYVEDECRGSASLWFSFVFSDPRCQSRN